MIMNTVIDRYYISVNSKYSSLKRYFIINIYFEEKALKASLISNNKN
jgi:hypothetical protein